MTNHSRLNLRQLSWLVILLTISILAAGALTRAFADSPEVTRSNDASGQSTVETVEIIPSGLPSQDLREEASIPLQVVDSNLATVDQELPQQDPSQEPGINDAIDMWTSDDIDLRDRGSHLANNLLDRERERIRNQVIKELGAYAFATFDIDEPPEGERRTAELEQQSPVFQALREALGSNDPEVAARTRDAMWERCEDCGLQYEDGPCSDCFSPTFDLSDPVESGPGQPQPFHEGAAAAAVAAQDAPQLPAAAGSSSDDDILASDVVIGAKKITIVVVQKDPDWCKPLVYERTYEKKLAGGITLVVTTVYVGKKNAMRRRSWSKSNCSTWQAPG